MECEREIERKRKHQWLIHTHTCSCLADGCRDSRAVLHLDGADLLETFLGQVAALSEQVHPTALEVLKLKEVYLGGNT